MPKTSTEYVVDATSGAGTDTTNSGSSHPRRRYLWLASVVVTVAAVALIVIIVGLIRAHSGSDTTALTLGSGTSTSAVYSLEKVTTPQAQAQGLSGRSGLAANTGMLFAYDQTAQRCMWMKDMKFIIDIVWFDENGRISSVASDLSPATYPRPYCADARNVVELPKDTASKYGLRVGQTVKF